MHGGKPQNKQVKEGWLKLIIWGTECFSFPVEQSKKVGEKNSKKCIEETFSGQGGVAWPHLPFTFHLF